MGTFEIPVDSLAATSLMQFGENKQLYSVRANVLFGVSRSHTGRKIPREW